MMNANSSAIASAAPDPKRPLAYAHSRVASHNFTHPLPAAKGKLKDSDNFRFGPSHFIPLLDSRHSPLQWSSSSLIISAHGTEPRVACLHFPSNKYFLLPDPPAVSASSASYEPPTIITTSSRDDWIFAYFPGMDVDGVGCFWNKSSCVDDWSVKDWKSFARGDGVVAARWLNPERDWSISDSGASIRLPPLGPFIPSLHPILCVVTETRLCDVFYIHPQSEKMHMLSASLARRSISKEGRERLINERVDGPQGLGRCVYAAIGLGYDESSILVSMTSSYVPSAKPEMGSPTSADLRLSMTVPSSQEPEAVSNWDMWRDQSIIENCEVNIFVEGFLLAITTTPLPSIRDFSQPNRSLTSMTFVPSLLAPNNQAPFPSTPTQTHRRVTPQSSPATVPAHVSQSPGRPVLKPPLKGAAAKPGSEKAKKRPSGNLYLICTTLERTQFASPPSSEIILYTLWRNPADPQTWYFRRTSQLHMPSSVAVHLSPSLPVGATQHNTALLGVLHREGLAVKPKPERRLKVGQLQLLRLPELQIDNSSEPLNLLCPVGPFGVELPFSFAVSPNRALVCAIPATRLVSFNSNVSASIHQHPSKAFSGQQLSAIFIQAALRRRFAPSDVIVSQYMNRAPLSVIEESFSAALLDFETNFGSSGPWINEVIGVAVETFRRRSLHSGSAQEIDDLTLRYQTGLEICSLSACNLVWEDTFGPKEYDPNAIWNLISLATYLIEDLLGKLLRECIHFASEAGWSRSRRGTQDTSGPTKPEDATQTSLHLSGSFVHLVHPYALDLLHTSVQHVRRFRGFLGSNIRSEEHLQVAREVLIDCVDSSPIDLEALDMVLSEIKVEVKANAQRQVDLTRRCLVALRPSPEFIPSLRKIVSKLIQPQVVNKLDLFIRSDDLVDGVLGLSMNSSGKTRERDIVTKRYLTGQSPTLHCLRCGGKSEINAEAINPQGQSSPRWVIWERTWQARCICGGLWSSRF